VAYRGDSFAGSQVQTESRTVEGEFIAACRRLDLFSDWKSAGFAAAGRTDRGVHAIGQVFAFSTLHPERAVAALNFQLPKDCWVTGFSRVPDNFHPRYDAQWRSYRYYFGDESLALPRMEEAARFLPGVHDFSGFARPAGKNPVRKVLSVSVGEEEGVPYFEITAESFLWHMVRCIATLLREAGSGRCSPDAVRQRLCGEFGAGLPPAPAGGLVLWDVGFAFPFTSIVPDDRRMEVIREWTGYHRVMTRICRVFYFQ